MPTQTIEFIAPSGMALTAKVFAEGSDTPLATASTIAEQANRRGVYRATFSGLSGLYQLIAFSETQPICSWWGRVSDVEKTYFFSDASEFDEIAKAVWDTSSADHLLPGTFGKLLYRAAQIPTGITVHTTQGEDGTIAVFNHRTYDGTAHSKLAFTVSKDYQPADSIAIKVFDKDHSQTIYQTIPATADSATEISVNGFTVDPAGGVHFTGNPLTFEARYSLIATWGTETETISTGQFWIFDQPE